MSRPFAYSIAILLLCMAAIRLPAQGHATANGKPPRAPRFLLASEPVPVPLEVSRTAVLRRRLTLDLDDVTVREALAIITARADLQLTYTDDIIARTARVRLHATDITVAAALTQVLLDADVDVVFSAANRASLVRRSRGAIPPVTGTIIGQIFEDGTLKPLALVHVSVVGTNLRAVTNEKGVYALPNVPVGKVTVNARLLGFVPKNSAASVTERDTAVVNVVLQHQATVLSDVVTTATGDQRRVAVAAEISRLNVDSVMASAPIRSVTDLLDSRIPGVHVTRGSGDVGSQTRIRIGGISSATLSNDPIVILDGVRIAGPGTLDGIHRMSSALDDIDPRSLESVEVVHGPAAAALYGTDAANGVIILTSKTGAVGPTRWTVHLTHDWTTIPTRYPAIYTGWGHDPTSDIPVQCNLFSAAVGACTIDSVSTFNPLNSPFTKRLGNGSNTQYSVSAQGGANQMTYSVTGSYTTASNPERTSRADLVRARLYNLPVPSAFRDPAGQTASAVSAIVSLQPYRSLDIGISANARRQSQFSNTMYSGISDADTLTMPQTTVRQLKLNDDLTSGMGALSATWRVTPKLTASGTVGMQHSANEQGSGADYYSCLIPQCVKNSGASSIGYSNGSSNIYTAHLSVSFQTPLGSLFNSTTSYLGDYNRTNITSMDITGYDIAEGSTNIGTARTLSTNRMNSAAATAGMSIAEVLAYRDRMYLTLAVRRDAGSAFGSNINAPLYPQAGVSWIISNEPFFPTFGLINTMQLRLAYGQSAVQPLATQLYPVYTTGFGNVDGQPISTILLSGVGNSTLQPERSAQFEGGVTADLWHNRLHVQFTGSSKRQHNAIISRILAPSAPGGLTQAINVGSVINRTIDASASLQVIDTRDLRWDVGIGANMLRNKVLALGNATVSSNTGTVRVAVGYPLDGTWQIPVLGIHTPPDGSFLQPSDVVYGDTSVYLGYSQPTYVLNYNSTVSLPRTGISVTTNMSYTGDYLLQQFTYNGYGLNDPRASLAEQAYAAIARTNGDWQNVSVFRINSINLTWALPPRFAARLRAHSASLTMSGANLGMWTRYKGADPSINSALTAGNYGNPDVNVDNGGTTPLTRNWSLGLSLGFQCAYFFSHPRAASR